VRDDVPPTHSFVRAICSIVVTAAVVVATYYLMAHIVGRTRL
jgi:predicted secreted protein